MLKTAASIELLGGNPDPVIFTHFPTEGFALLIDDGGSVVDELVDEALFTVVVDMVLTNVLLVVDVVLLLETEDNEVESA